MYILQRYSFYVGKFPKTINIFLSDELFSVLSHKYLLLRHKKDLNAIIADRSNFGEEKKDY